jgi:(2Fe-2S) ferredoxin
MMNFYSHHVFFCLNERNDGRECCASQNATKLQEYAKAKVKSLGLAGEGRVRINKAGCLDRCEHGPVIVVYPEAIWYTLVDEHDVDEIVESHLGRGIPVKRLMIDAPATGSAS